MPLVGGGGAPNVAGSNPSGVGSSINYVGEYAYAFSGTFECDTSPQTCLQFNTSNEFLVGKWFLSGGVNYASGNLGDGQHTGYKITINGEIVSMVKLSSITEAMPTTATEPMLIPPFSSVKVEVLSSAASATQLSSCSFVGRVY